MKRYRRRRSLGALPEGVKPWHIALGVAALGGIAYFAMRKPSEEVAAEAAIDTAAAAVVAGEASPTGAAEQAVASDPAAAQTAAAATLGPQLAVAAMAANPADAPKTPAGKAVMARVLTDLIKKNRVKVPANLVKVALARDIANRTGVGTGAKKIAPTLDPCAGLTGEAGVKCRANKAFTELNTLTR